MQDKPKVLTPAEKARLAEIEGTVRIYCGSPPSCTRECQHLGALMQVAFKEFRVDFRARPWSCGLALMPRRIPWHRIVKGNTHAAITA